MATSTLQQALQQAWTANGIPVTGAGYPTLANGTPSLTPEQQLQMGLTGALQGVPMPTTGSFQNATAPGVISQPGMSAPGPAMGDPGYGDPFAAAAQTNPNGVMALQNMIQQAQNNPYSGMSREQIDAKNQADFQRMKASGQTFGGLPQTPMTGSTQGRSAANEGAPASATGIANGQGAGVGPTGMMPPSSNGQALNNPILQAMAQQAREAANNYANTTVQNVQQYQNDGQNAIQGYRDQVANRPQEANFGQMQMSSQYVPRREQPQQQSLQPQVMPREGQQATQQRLTLPRAYQGYGGMEGNRATMGQDRPRRPNIARPGQGPLPIQHMGQPNVGGNYQQNPLMSALIRGR